MSILSLTRRSRRNRSNPAVRDLIQESRVDVTDLIQPLFVVDGDGAPQAIDSMPGIARLPLDHLLEECARVVDLGLRAVALFPKIDPAHKDAQASYALREDNLLLRTVRAVKAAFPSLLVITDVALDPYTAHGHDGVLNAEGSDVDNDRSVALLAELAVLEARAGADWVAPSDMMDGRVGAIRRALDDAGFAGTGLLAYAAKFASAYYGPFREAVGSDAAAGTASLDKRTYQLNPANAREALLDARLDEEEGADVLLVKPAGLYLDVLRMLRDETSLPLAAYQVSGEYAQIHAAARLGWLDLRAARDEALLAIKRAGADMILTYFASEVARDLRP